MSKSTRTSRFFTRVDFLNKNDVKTSLTVYRVFLFAAGDSHYAKGQSANIHSKSMLVPLSFSDAVEPIGEQGMS